MFRILEVRYDLHPFSIRFLSRVRALAGRVCYPRLCTIIRNMADGGGFKETHLERTESVPREEIMVSAAVVNLFQLSKTVQGLTLKINDRLFSFKAGQWVDFFIPRVPIVGGFSICSSPRTLDEEHIIDLAVKNSTHAPAHWVHTQCKVGDTVQMRAGGTFFYDPKPGTACRDLLLIAGGIGINPLYSIIKHTIDLRKGTQGQLTGRIVLLFTASTVDELLYRESLTEISKEFPRFLSCKFFVTKEGVSDSTIQGHRINDTNLQEAVSSLNEQELVSYVCGPTSMIQYTISALKKLGISDDRIQYEKWW